MTVLENVITSLEVAQMIGKDHALLLRDLRRYINQFNECNFAVVEFFQESTYEDSKGETRPCFQITKKGCEFIAHKLTGTKGTLFTAKYINRFHEMKCQIEQENQDKIVVIEKTVSMQEQVLKRICKKIDEINFVPEYTVDSYEQRYQNEILRMLRILWIETDESMWSQIYTVFNFFMDRKVG